MYVHGKYYGFVRLVAAKNEENKKTKKQKRQGNNPSDQQQQQQNPATELKRLLATCNELIYNTIDFDNGACWQIW